MLLDKSMDVWLIREGNWTEQHNWTESAIQLMLGEKAAAHFYFLTQFGPTLQLVQHSMGYRNGTLA